MYGSDNSWLLGIPLRAERDGFEDFTDDDVDSGKMVEVEVEVEVEDEEDDEDEKEDNEEEDDDKDFE